MARRTRPLGALPGALAALSPPHQGIQELRSAGLKVIKGTNAIRLGVAAVTARLRTGRLKVLSTKCWNLIEEAKLYRYPDKSERAVLGENPIDENNHALAALRYLI